MKFFMLPQKKKKKKPKNKGMHLHAVLHKCDLFFRCKQHGLDVKARLVPSVAAEAETQRLDVFLLPERLHTPHRDGVGGAHRCHAWRK